MSFPIFIGKLQPVECVTAFRKTTKFSWGGRQLLPYCSVFLKTSQSIVWHVFTCFLTGFDWFEAIWNSQNFRLFGRKGREKFFEVWKQKFEGVDHTDHNMKTYLQHLKSSNPSRKKSYGLCFGCEIFSKYFMEIQSSNLQITRKKLETNFKFEKRLGFRLYTCFHEFWLISSSFWPSE